MFQLFSGLQENINLDFFLVTALGATLLSTVGWLLSRGLVKYAALQHLVLFSALIGCLLAPLAAWVSSATDWKLVSLPILTEIQQPVVTKASLRPIVLPTVSKTVGEKVLPKITAFSCPETISTINSNDKITFSSLPQITGTTTSLVCPTNIQPNAFQERGLPTRQDFLTGFIFVWLAGIFFMFAWSSRNYLQVLRLQRSGQPLRKQQIQTLLKETAELLHLRKIPILLVSKEVVTPLAVGLLRPSIILPARLLEEIDLQSLRAILIHEAAHIRRSDQRIVMLQAVAGALFWPILSVHAINRELQRVREEICDNAVLAHHDAKQYGETLLRVAQLCMHARSVCAAVGMLGRQGELERRITALLDPRQNRKTSTSRWTTGLVTLLFAVGTLLISVTQWTSSAAIAEAPPRSSNKTHITKVTTSSDQTTESSNNQNPPIVLQGKILGPQGQPVVGAQLYLNIDEWQDSVALGMTDANGAYRFTVPGTQLRRSTIGNMLYAKCQATLIVVAPGLGTGWAELPAKDGSRFNEMQSEYTRDIPLVKEFPITGTIIDRQGYPIADAEITIKQIFDISPEGPWHKMAPAITACNPTLMTREETDPNGWSSPVYPMAWRGVLTVKTDTEGRFQMAGVGPDRAIQLEVAGPGVMPTTFSILTHPGANEFTQSVRDKYPRRPKQKKQSGDQGVQIYGPESTFAVDRASTISGIVRDATTGEPVSQIRVTPHHYTDRNGHYRFPYDRNQPGKLKIIVSPKENKRYLRVTHDFHRAAEPGEILADINLPRGVIIHGRVIEADTGDPILSARRQHCHDLPGQGPLRAGRVIYFPLAANTALQDTPAGAYFALGKQFCRSVVVIDGAGRFQIAVPPGPGVLLIQAALPNSFPLLLTDAEKENAKKYLVLENRNQQDGAPGGDSKSFAGFMGSINLGQTHAYEIINPTIEDTQLELTIAVTKAPARKNENEEKESLPQAKAGK